MSRRHTGPLYRWLLAVMIATLAASLTGVPAVAAPPSTVERAYTVSLTAPDTVPVREAFTYTVDLRSDGRLGAPLTGVELVATLPAGLAFDSVPLGGASPVVTRELDATSNSVTFRLGELVQPLITFAFSVRQVDDRTKDTSTVFATTLTGAATPGGDTPSSSASTRVTGALGYAPLKSVAPVPGSGNRDLTYFVNVTTSSLDSLTSWGQRITDHLPAGVSILSSSTVPGGSWAVSGSVENGLTAVWSREGTAYGPSLSPLDPSRREISLTVRYPESGFAVGTRPPANTVSLESADRSGRFVKQGTASVQGPVIVERPGKEMTVRKDANFDTGADAFAWGNGQSLATYGVTASYLNGVDSESLDTMTVTDDSSHDAETARFFRDNDVYRVAVLFNSVLKAEKVPYAFQYTTNLEPTFRTYGSGLETSSDLRINTQQVGSVKFDQAPYDKTLQLAVGERITGWRVVVSPADGDAEVVRGSAVTVGTGYVPILSGPAGGGAEYVNTATAEGTLLGGKTLTPASDSSAPATVDRVPLVAAVTAPATLSVGEASAYTATIANLDPRRTYADSKLTVVLPPGVHFDASTGVARLRATAVGSGVPVPAPGDGLTVDVASLESPEGEREVVTLRFDALAPVRVAGQPKSADAVDGFGYRIPVSVQPQAFRPGAATVEAFASTDDPAYAGVPMGYVPHYYGPDRYDVNPLLDRVAADSASSAVTTAGGLMLGKLVRADAAEPWSVRADIGAAARAFWQVSVVNVLARPVTDLVLFDRLPAAGDARGSSFPVRLDAPVDGLPAGASVEYSTDAVSAGDGSWSGNPDGATAVRVGIPQLAAGQSLDLRLSTAVPAGLDHGIAVNAVSATAIYDGVKHGFASNDASIVTAAHPAVAIEKRTNGVRYDEAPGALVATGSRVVWSYVVTNTGDVPLSDIAVSDAFTDGSGESGALTPTSTDAGPLAPGGSRTFSAEDDAVAGQYRNTATVTAAAASPFGPSGAAQQVSATASSWYLSGETGLTVVKLTNGRDVAAAPGPAIMMGDSVTWNYDVTNTGTIPLTDIRVVDLAAGGATVHDETIPVLAPGASVRLTADGSAVLGQYENTVTVSAVDPMAGGELRSSDRSWYTGIPLPTLGIEAPDASTLPGAPAPGAPQASAGLAMTGAHVLPTLVTMLGVLAAGALLFWLGRRRRARRDA